MRIIRVGHGKWHPVMPPFVCEACRNGEHCGRDRDDTWCDCQHREDGYLR